MRHIPETRVWRIHYVCILLILVIVLLECIIWLDGTHCDFIIWVLFQSIKILTCRVLAGFHTFRCRHKHIPLSLIRIELIARLHIRIIDIILLCLIVSILTYILIWMIGIIFGILLLIYIDRLIECILLVVIERRWLGHAFVTVVDHHLFQRDSVRLLSERIGHTGMFIIIGLIVHIEPILIIAVLPSHL